LRYVHLAVKGLRAVSAVPQLCRLGFARLAGRCFGVMLCRSLAQVTVLRDKIQGFGLVR